MPLSFAENGFYMKFSPYYQANYKSMALQKVVRAFGALGISLALAAYGVIAFGSSVAHADSVPLGSQIVCAVFGGLDVFGNPIPPLGTDDCPGTSTDSGGGGSGGSNSGNTGGAGGSGGTTPTTGVLAVRKVFSAGAISPTLFSFSVNNGSPTAFNSNGENDLAVEAGTYDVVESATSTYAASYSGCSGIIVVAAATSTCTITNTPTAAATGDGGGSAGSGTGSATQNPTDNSDAPPASDPGGGSSGGSSGGGGGSAGQNGQSDASPASGGGGNGPIVGSFGLSANGPLYVAGKVLGAATTTLPAACSQYLTSFIRAGRSNDTAQVTRLQKFLNDYEGDSLALSGVYDAATLAATKAFQSKFKDDILAPWHISGPTGYVYLTTRREVNAVYCHFTQNFPLSAGEQAIVDGTGQ